MSAAFTFDKTVSITEESSSCDTARLTKRCKARLSEPETRGGSEGRFVSSGNRGKGRPLSFMVRLRTSPESISAGKAACSTRPRLPFGAGTGRRGSLDCLSPNVSLMVSGIH